MMDYPNPSALERHPQSLASKFVRRLCRASRTREELQSQERRDGGFHKFDFVDEIGFLLLPSTNFRTVPPDFDYATFILYPRIQSADWKFSNPDSDMVGILWIENRNQPIADAKSKIAVSNSRIDRGCKIS